MASKKMTQQARILSALRDGCTFRRVKTRISGRHSDYWVVLDRIARADGRQTTVDTYIVKKMFADGLLEKGAEIPGRDPEVYSEEDGGHWWLLTAAGHAASALLPGTTMDELFPVYVPPTDEERAVKLAKATLRLMFQRGERLLHFHGDSWALQPMAARGYTRHWGARHVDLAEMAAMGDAIEDFVDTDGKPSKRLTDDTVIMMTRRQRTKTAAA